jgi:hypothetical protein
MINKFFELERLRSSLQNRGIDERIVSAIVKKAEVEIDAAIESRMQSAMDEAVSVGADKNSTDFINEIAIDYSNYYIRTTSGNTDFSEPPFPMLPKLLQGAKPMKDGSGVYKVIPMGSSSNNSVKLNNIFDTQKAINVERLLEAKRKNKSVSKGSTKFRTATSKQSADTNWVIPAKEKDFSEDLTDINNRLENDLKNIILSVIKEYEDNW